MGARVPKLLPPDLGDLRGIDGRVPGVSGLTAGARDDGRSRALAGVPRERAAGTERFVIRVCEDPDQGAVGGGQIVTRPASPRPPRVDPAAPEPVPNVAVPRSGEPAWSICAHL